MKNVVWKLVPDFFNSQGILHKKQSEETCVLIWTNVDSFADTYLI